MIRTSITWKIITIQAESVHKEVNDFSIFSDTWNMNNLQFLCCFSCDPAVFIKVFVHFSCIVSAVSQMCLREMEPPSASQHIANAQFIWIFWRIQMITVRCNKEKQNIFLFGTLSCLYSTSKVVLKHGYLPVYFLHPCVIVPFLLLEKMGKMLRFKWCYLPVEHILFLSILRNYLFKTTSYVLLYSYLSVNFVWFQMY